MFANLTKIQLFASALLFSGSLSAQNTRASLSATNNISTNSNSFSYNYVDPFSQAGESTSLWGLWFQSILLLAIFAFIAWVFVRLFNRRRNTGEDSSIASVVLNYPLGTNKQMKVFKLAEEYYLIGVGGDNIQLISKITEKETIDSLKIEEGKTTATKQGQFSQMLEQLIPVKDGVRATQQLVDRLRGRKR